MVIERRHLQQHLELAAQAYGLDLPLAPGAVQPRTTPPPSAEPRPAANPTAPPAAAALTATGTEADSVAAMPRPSRAPATTAPPAAREPSAAAPTASHGDDKQSDARRSDDSPSDANLSDAGGDGQIDGQLGEPVDDPVARLQALRNEVLPCTRCKLSQGRTHTVFGEGNPRARVMFIGEAPGAREDQTGRPFVGDAGQLLDRIITGAMGLQRQDVYIANINKCRPPGNRAPEPDEVAACLPFLRQQIEIVRPEVLVCLGRTAAQNLLSTTASTTALRGRELEYLGIPVVVTWHPAYLLREPAHKRETWEDIKRVNRLLGRPEVPPAGAG